jgi:hypothetical protein
MAWTPDGKDMLVLGLIGSAKGFTGQRVLLVNPSTRATSLIADTGTRPVDKKGFSALGSLAESPDGKQVRWVGSDGDLVVHPLHGGKPGVLRTLGKIADFSVAN